jgi:hypothetical protein
MMASGLKEPIPGFKSILISEATFEALRTIQLANHRSHDGVRFDLKDIATAALNVVLAQEDAADLVMRQARVELKARL